MKKTIVLSMAIVAMAFSACNSTDKSVTDNPYMGAWQLTYAKYIFPDSIAETSNFTEPTVKLVTNKHYAFGRQDGINKIRGGGGEYTLRDSLFVTHPKYHSTLSAGDSIVIKSKVEGDTWTLSFTTTYKSMKVDAVETWKRIKE